MIHDRSRRLDELSLHAQRSLRRILQDRESRLARLAGKIESLSPLAVLARGYTITLDEATHSVVRDAHKLKVGQTIVTRFSQGEAVSKVEKIERK